MRPRKIWLITDTHWYHDKTVEWCGRPANFTELSIANCRRLCQPQDTLLHLGDVIFKNQDKLKQILDSIPGVKILVRGNHDKETGSWYSRRGFHVVCNSMVLKDILFSHKPQVIPADLRLNIHGHFHNSDHRSNEPEFQQILEPRHRLLALEHVNYAPVDLQAFSR